MTRLAHQALGHLVKRGVRACNNMTDEQKMEAMDKMFEHYRLPGWGIGIMAATAMFFFLLIASADYTFSDVVATLMMAEAPTPAVIIERTVAVEEPDAPLEKTPFLDTESIVVAPRAVTCTPRSTMIQMTRAAGWTSRWRGLRDCLIYSSMTALFANLISGFTMCPNPLVLVIGQFVFRAFHMAWTHAMVVHPDSVKGKSWRQRLPSREASKKVMIATLMYSLAQQLTLAAPIAVGLTVGLTDSVDFTDSTDLLFTGLTMGSAFFFVAYFMLLPAHIALVRLEVAALPEEYDTIVPIDRTCGGLISSEASQWANYRAVWLSTRGDIRKRLVKLYVLLYLWQTMTFLLWVVTAISQLALIMGPRFDIMVRGIAAHIREAYKENQ